MSKSLTTDRPEWGVRNVCKGVIPLVYREAQPEWSVRMLQLVLPEISARAFKVFLLRM